MPETPREDKFTVWPQRLAVDEATLAYRWSVYVVRVDLAHRGQLRALKIGMVGSGTIGQRLKDHAKSFGPNELLDAWTLAHAVSQFDVDPAWRLVEQYEARLQFAPEFVDPGARLRRLRPDSLVYSYEWFEDDPRVLEAVERYAHLPVTLPHGWTIADRTRPTEGPGEGRTNTAPD
jgi:hypothetical protein